MCEPGLRHLFVMVLISMLVSVAARTGTIIDVKTTHFAGDRGEEEATIFLDENRMRFEAIEDGKRSVVIFRLEDGNDPVCWVIDEGQKAYFEITKESAQEFQSKIQEAKRAYEEQMKNIPPDHYTRHPSKKNLMDIVDLFIDNYNEVGDCVLQIEGFDRPFGPISSMTDAFIARRMDIEAIKYMVGRGFKPPVYMSANRPGGDEANEELINKYYHRIKNL